MGLLSAFVLRPALWDREAEAWARLLPHDSPEDYGDLFSRLVKTGEAFAFELVKTDENRRVGIVVARVDKSYKTGELHIKGAFSVENYGDLTAEFLPELEAKARELGCATIRFHTMRPGLVSKAMRAGFRVCEVICRKDVRHV